MPSPRLLHEASLLRWRRLAAEPSHQHLERSAVTVGAAAFHKEPSKLINIQALAILQAQ
jgi:hypothetical protein